MREHPALSKEAVDALSNARGEAAAEWLIRLPEILTACEKRWELKIGSPFPNLSYNYVAGATRSDGCEVVLKVCPPDDFECRTELDALRIYAGRGVVRLLECEAGTMLLEKLSPGTPLSSELDDEKATSIACDGMSSMWVLPPAQHSFPTTIDWASGLERLRKEFDGATGPLPPVLVERSEKLFAELHSSQSEPVLLHGDLHHDNILLSSRGWLAIDPKGLVGEREYEIGAWLRNPLPELLASGDAVKVTRRRLDQFADRFSFDRNRLKSWAFAQAVLSAWWHIEDSGHGWESSIQFSELLLNVPD